MNEITTDEIGRTFCKKHNRETCHECCMCFEPTNRMAEERAGLVKKRTEMEVAAEEYVQAMFALRKMERMVPRPAEERFVQTREWHDRNAKKLEEARKKGEEDVDAAVRKAIENEERRDMDMQAMVNAWGAQNPGKTKFEFGGPESQKLFEQFVAKPNYGKTDRVDLHTCAYCHEVSLVELKFCAKCKKVVYCNRDCQKKAWKAHKLICVEADTDKVKSARLTWEQLEALQGQTAEGQTIELRVIVDEHYPMRQVVYCKDRNDVMKRVAVYTDSKRIPGLQPGAILKWKNPRFHYFMDGSSGARIEQDDLVNIQIK